MDKTYRETALRFGRLDVVFANAGVGDYGPIEAVTEADFDRIVGVNFKGVFFTLQKALPHLGSGGAIVVNASLTAYQGLADFSVYSATKAAVQALARTFAAALAPRHIRVNSISPGIIATPMLDKVELTDEQMHAQVSAIPLGRLGQPDEIARAVLFLASDDASYVTGEDLLVDGGRINLP